MKDYAVMYRSDDGSREIVKLTWNWAALFFGIVWMLSKRLWSEAAVFLIVYTVIFSIADEATLAIAELAMHIWLALNGPSLVSRSLRRRGYHVTDTVKAKSKRDVMRKFMDRGKPWG